MPITKLALYDGQQISVFKTGALAVSALSYIKSNNGVLEIVAEGDNNVRMLSGLTFSSGKAISSGGNGSLSIGVSGDTINLNVPGVTYNVGTLTGNLVVTGNITSGGTTTTLNATNIQISDKNIELGVVASPSNLTADGGGITLKGSTDKTITWINTTQSWDFNQPIHINADTARLGALGSSQSLTFVGTGGGNAVITWNQAAPRILIGGSGAQPTAFEFYTNGTNNTSPIRFGSGSTPAATFAGTVSIGNTDATHRLNVTGDVNIAGNLFATVKNFRITDKNNPDYVITYGAIEGPENAVFYRGKVDINKTSCVIKLPEEWVWLIDDKSVSVYLSAEDFTQNLIYQFRDNMLHIYNKKLFAHNIHCSYLIIATRKDVSALKVRTKNKRS